MYLNEKAWEAELENSYKAGEALKAFLDVYKILAGKYHMPDIYVPAADEPYFRSVTYTVGKWMSEADIEYKRLFLSFWQRRVTYEPEDEFEVCCESGALKGGTEAVLNDSFMLSICLKEAWKKPEIAAGLFSLADDTETPVIVRNVYEAGQLDREPIASILRATQEVKIYSYRELWEKRGSLFPHLCFCPSVKKNLESLELCYIHQVIRKLTELEAYCVNNPGQKFKPELLTKTTMESDETIKKYRKQHTFRDETGTEYLVSWHMRFTGIPGRIFFIPEYSGSSILICYIGKKLSNVTYPT